MSDYEEYCEKCDEFHCIAKELKCPSCGFFTLIHNECTECGTICGILSQL